METSGAAGKGYGGWVNGGLEICHVSSPRYVFFVICYCYTNEYLKIGCVTMELAGPGEQIEMAGA